MQFHSRYLPMIGYALCTVAPLASGKDLSSGLRLCAAEVDAGRRLECYDREVARLMGAAPVNRTPAAIPAVPDTSALVATAPPVAPPSALSPEEQFGLDEALASMLRQDKGISPRLQRLTARVTGISKRPQGELVITLDNAQVWEQTEQRPSFSVSRGATVTIATGALGSFWLDVDSHNATRVKRVR
jgi:hypothetical protein